MIQISLSCYTLVTTQLQSWQNDDFKYGTYYIPSLWTPVCLDATDAMVYLVTLKLAPDASLSMKRNSWYHSARDTLPYRYLFLQYFTGEAIYLNLLALLHSYYLPAFLYRSNWRTLVKFCSTTDDFHQPRVMHLWSLHWAFKMRSTWFLDALRYLYRILRLARLHSHF
jgi:hypothetical protein